MENNPFADSLSECCGGDAEMYIPSTGKCIVILARCMTCKNRCTVKPRTLGIDVHEDIRITEQIRSSG